MNALWHDAAEQASRYHQGIADEVRLAFSIGPAARISADDATAIARPEAGGLVTLAAMVSEELCDLPGNALHDVIRLIGKRALAGDVEARAIVERIAKARADWMTEQAEDFR